MIAFAPGAQANTILKITCKQFKGAMIEWDAKKHPEPYAQNMGFGRTEITIAAVAHAATASLEPPPAISGTIAMKPAYVGFDTVMLVSSRNGGMIPLVNNVLAVTFYPKLSVAVYTSSFAQSSPGAATDMEVAQCEYNHHTFAHLVHDLHPNWPRPKNWR